MSEPFTANSADPEQVHAAAELADSRRKQEVNDLHRLLATPEFRRFCLRFMERAGVHRSSFSSDPLEMALREGNRNHGNWLLAEITEADFRAYLLMLSEDHERRAREQVAVQASRPAQDDND